MENGFRIGGSRGIMLGWPALDTALPRQGPAGIVHARAKWERSAGSPEPERNMINFGLEQAGIRGYTAPMLPVDGPRAPGMQALDTRRGLAALEREAFVACQGQG